MSHPNTRAMRRVLARRYADNKLRLEPRRFAQKNWKLVYLRSNKLKRARQIGKIWPHKEWNALMADVTLTHVLFICSRNQWRSPTGERVFARRQGLSTRSAGTSRNARRKVNINDIRWADIILVMEEKHASRLRAEFRDEVRYKTLHVLDIPDDYRFMDDELIELLHRKVEPLLASN